MGPSAFLLGAVVLLQSQCTSQKPLDHYILKRSQDPHDVDYSLSEVKLSELETVKPSHSPEDGKYSDDDYDNVDNIKAVPGKAGIDYPILDKVPETSFSCETRPEGYYADPETGCQVFHICLAQSIKTSFLCPNGSIFSQDLFTCDWWNRVYCPQNINQDKHHSQMITRSKVLSTSGKSNNIVENISIGEAKKKNNMVISQVNDFKGSMMITSRAQLVRNTRPSVTVPVVATEQSKSNEVQSVISNLVLPIQYKCCNYSEDSTLSEPLQIHLLNLEQMRLSIAPMKKHNSVPTLVPSSQKNIKNDSSLIPFLESLRSSKQKFTTTNLDFQKNVQNSVSFSAPIYTTDNNVTQKADDILEYTKSRQGSPHINKTLLSGQVTNLFDDLYSVPRKHLTDTTPNTLELPNFTLRTLQLQEHIPVSQSELLQSTTPSTILKLSQHVTPTIVLNQSQHTIPSVILKQSEYTTPSKILKLSQQTTPSTILKLSQHTIPSTIQKLSQYITPSTILKLSQYTTPSTLLQNSHHITSSAILKQSQNTTPSIVLKQPQHAALSHLEEPQNITIDKFDFPLNATAVSILQLSQTFFNNSNLHNQSNFENNYENSTGSYLSQASLNVSDDKHIPHDVSKSVVNECGLTNNCSNINSPPSDSEDVDTQSMNHLNNTKGKNLFIFGTLIDPFKKYDSELHPSGIKRNKELNRINTQVITDISKSKEIYSPLVNRASTPVPFRNYVLLQQPSTQFALLTDKNRGSRHDTIEREQSTQISNLEVSDIVKLNNLNSVNNQHNLSEHNSNYKPTIVKSISFNFDTDEGRKEFDLAVSSGLLSEV